MNKAFLHGVRIVNKIYVGVLLVLIASTYVLSSGTQSLTDITEDQVIARIGLLSPAEKSLLKDKLERFRRLTLSEQQHLREFHSALDNHDKRTDLLNVLRKYNDWVNQLTPGDRVAMQAADVSDRNDTVTQIHKAQLRDRFQLLIEKELKLEDSLELIEWLESIHKRPDDNSEVGPIEIYEVLNQGHEVLALLEGLSSGAQQKYFLTPKDEQTDLIQSWIASAIWLQYWSRKGLDDAEFARFFAEDLNEQERRMIEQSSDFRTSLFFVYNNKSGEREQQLSDTALASDQNTTNPSKLNDGASAPGIGTTVIGAVPFMRQAIEELIPDLDQDQLALLEELSPGASSVIAAMEDTASDAEKVLNWVKNAMKSQFFSRADVPEQDLQAFLENDLTDEEREYLKQVPPLQYRKTLLFLYYQKQDEVEKNKNELPEPNEDPGDEKPTSENAQ